MREVTLESYQTCIYIKVKQHDEMPELEKTRPTVQLKPIEKQLTSFSIN